MLKLREGVSEARRRLLADTRRAASITGELARRSFALQVPLPLMWAAAGAGLAERHKLAGVTVDLRAELANEPDVPDAFFDGYNSEMLAGALASELKHLLEA